MNENIYHFYHKILDFGFCVRRSSWALTTFARVVYVEGVKPGKPIPGKPPYYYNPHVYAVLYMAKRKPEAINLSVPGGYSYELIECPPFEPKELKNGFTYTEVKYIPTERK